MRRAISSRGMSPFDSITRLPPQNAPDSPPSGASTPATSTSTRMSSMVVRQRRIVLRRRDLPRRLYCHHREGRRNTHGRHLRQRRTEAARWIELAPASWVTVKTFSIGGEPGGHRDDGVRGVMWFFMNRPALQVETTWVVSVPYPADGRLGPIRASSKSTQGILVGLTRQRRLIGRRSRQAESPSATVSDPISLSAARIRTRSPSGHLKKP